jgi:hypothetical protein
MMYGCDLADPSGEFPSVSKAKKSFIGSNFNVFENQADVPGHAPDISGRDQASGRTRNIPDESGAGLSGQQRRLARLGNPMILVV